MNGLPEACDGVNRSMHTDVHACASAHGHSHGDADQFDAFSQLISERVVPMHFSTDDIGSFRARVRSTSLGVVQLSELWACNAFVGRRTRKLITSSSPDYLKVGVQLSGISVVSQGDQQARLHPGDFVLYDTTRPYEISAGASFHAQMVMFSRDALRLPPSQLERLTVRRINGREGLGLLMSEYLAGLRRQLSAGVRSGSCHLADATLDLLAASFAEQFTHPATTQLGRASLLYRVRTYIEHRLGDPHLDIANIAAAHHVSVRTLHKLFEDEDQTVAEWIRARRMEHCRRDLANPSLAELPVRSIGAEWGLFNPAHFSRLFKSTYGLSPRDYRVRALAGLP